MTARARAILIVVVGIVAVIAGRDVLAGTNEIPFKVDEPTAHRLVSESAKAPNEELHYTGDEDRSVSPFFNYVGLNETPAQESFGYFSVNPWTGDVWDLWGCRRLSTPALRKSQAEIRGRFTAAELKQYVKLRGLQPPCVEFKIDAPTARRLAAEGANAAEEDFDYQGGDDRRVYSPPFFNFARFCRTTASSGPCRLGKGVIIDSFSINPWTGDVWDPAGCRKVSTPALRQSQAEIRHRFTAKELKHYAILSRVQPCTLY